MDSKEFKIPNTIDIDQDLWEFITDEIRGENFLGLRDASNEQLMLFALALGWKNEINPDLRKRKGFIKSAVFAHSKLAVLVDAVHFEKIGFEDADALRDRKRAFELAERYANGGFKILKGDMQGGRNDMEYAYELISWMNDRHEMLFEK